MGFFAIALANKLRNRLMNGGDLEGDSGSPPPPQQPVDSQSTFQTPGFWQSLIDHKFGIDELAPLKAQLLDAQVKEQQLRNARFGIDAQHQDTLFGLTQAEMQAKNESTGLANTITKATMADKIQESGLNLDELKGKVAGTDAASIEQKSRAKYYDTLSQEQQMNLAKALGEASAGTQIGPNDVGALTDNFIKSIGVDKSQEGIAKSFYGPAIAGSLAQKQQQLGTLKQTNDMMTQQKRIDDISKLVQFGASSTDPNATIEGAGKFLGLDAETIDFAKQAAGTIKQPMVTPREDSYTKAKGEELQAAESVRRNLLSTKSSDGTVGGLSGKAKTAYDKQSSAVDAIRQELDNYQQGATTRQIPKKAAPAQMRGKPGATYEGALIDTNDVKKNNLTENLVESYLNANPYVLKFSDQQLESLAKEGGLNLDDLKAAVARRKKS